MENPVRDIDPREYLHLLKRRWWVVAAAVALVVAIQGYRVFHMTPVFQATATILIESKYPNIISMNEVLGANPEAKDYFQTQLGIINSRSMARKALAELEKAGIDAPASPPPTGFVAGAREAVKKLAGGEGGQARSVPEGAEAERLRVDSFLGNLRVRPQGKTRIVNLSFLSPDPEQAALAANIVAEVYIRQNLQFRLDTTRDAGSRLDDELAETRASLEMAEKKLQHYKEEKNLISFGEQRASITRRIEEVSSQAALARSERIELQSRYRRLRDLVEMGERDQLEINAIPEIVGNTLIQGLLAETASMQTEMMELLEMYTTKHPEVQSLNLRITELETRIYAEESKVVESLRHRYELVQQREARLEEMIEEQKKRALDLDRDYGEYAALEKEVASSNHLYERLEARTKETDLAGGLQTNNVRIIDRAEVPRAPISPNKRRVLVLAILMGLCGGVGLVFFLDHFDQSVRSPHDLEAVLGLPFLGPVPLLDKELAGNRKADLISLDKPHSPWSEAFKAIRTSLLFSSPDTPPRTLMVTSAGPGEGKTFVTANLAVKMAMAGRKVLLVDADMRKPRQHSVFKVKNSAGLSNVLTDQNDINTVLRKTPVPNLQLLAAGPSPPNPSELLGSERMVKLAALLRQRFDTVIFDTPPLITVTDAAILASRVDGVVFVVKSGATRKEILRRSKQKLEELQANILGVILNWMDMRKSSYYYYYSHYYSAYYGKEEDNSSDTNNNGAKKAKGAKSAARKGVKRPSAGR